MLAVLAHQAFDHKDWLFENKYDGYRIIAVCQEINVQLYSRNHVSFNKHFKDIVNELQKIKHRCVLDGEVVVKDAYGRSNFQLLQNFLQTGKGQLCYYVFDLLNLDGNDTTALPLFERKALLKILLKKQELHQLFYAHHSYKKGITFFEKAMTNKDEGILAKKRDSPYRKGQRSNDWLKIKIIQQEEAIIIGITMPQNSRNYFGALLLAQYDGKNLRFIGKCGTGFKEETLKELYQKFKPYFRNNPTVVGKISIRDTIQWMLPKFVCQIKFAQWTQGKLLRQPVFLGLRKDKKIKEVQFPFSATSHLN